jgi:hypothetical protein
VAEVLDVEADGAGEIALAEDFVKALVDRAFADGTPAEGVVLPRGFFHVNGVEVGTDRGEVERPGLGSLDGGVADVKGDADLIGGIVLEDLGEIPDRPAEVVFARVVLVDGLDPELGGEGDEVFQFGAELVELGADGLFEVILVVAHAVAFDALRGGGAEDLFGGLFVADLGDGGGHDGELERVRLERLDEFGEVVLDSLGHDMTGGTDGAFDPVEAHARDDPGHLVVGEMLERFREGAELVRQGAFSVGISFRRPAQEGGKKRGEGEAGRAFEEMAASGDGGVIHDAIVSALAGLGKS